MAVLIKDVEELLSYYKSLNFLKRYLLPQSLREPLEAFDINKDDNKKCGMALQVAHAYHQSQYSYLFLRSLPRLFFWLFPKILDFSRSPIARIPFLSDDLLVGEQGKAIFTSIMESPRPYELIDALIALYDDGELWSYDKNLNDNKYLRSILNSNNPHALVSILCLLDKNFLLDDNYVKVINASNLQALARNLLMLDTAKLLNDLDDNPGQRNFNSIIEIISKGQTLEVVMARLIEGEVFSSRAKQESFELLIGSINYSETCDFLIQEAAKLKNKNKIQANIERESISGDSEDIFDQSKEDAFDFSM